MGGDCAINIGRLQTYSSLIRITKLHLAVYRLPEFQSILMRNTSRVNKHRKGEEWLLLLSNKSFFGETLLTKNKFNSIVQQIGLLASFEMYCCQIQIKQPYLAINVSQGLCSLMNA